MKYLNQFFEYIKENKDLDMEEIESMLEPIKDMNIDIKYNSGIIVSDDVNDNCEYISVRFSIHDSVPKVVFILDGYNSTFMDGDITCEFLDEFLSFKNKCDGILSKKCFIKFNKSDYGLSFSIILIGNKLDSDNLLNTFCQKIQSIVNNMKTDYAYDTLVDINDDHIIVSTLASSYSDRKFNNLLNRSKINLPSINVTKSFDGSRDINKIYLK